METITFKFFHTKFLTLDRPIIGQTWARGVKRPLWKWAEPKIIMTCTEEPKRNAADENRQNTIFLPSTTKFPCHAAFRVCVFVNDSGAIPLMRQMEHFIVLSYLFTWDYVISSCPQGILLGRVFLKNRETMTQVRPASRSSRLSFWGGERKSGRTKYGVRT